MLPISRGLTTAEAAKCLKDVGPNTVTDFRSSPVRQALGKFWAPIPWILEAAILLQLVLGDYTEAAIIVLLLVFNAGLGLFEEGQAQARPEQYSIYQLPGNSGISTICHFVDLARRPR